MAMKLGSTTFSTYTPDDHDIPMAQKAVTVQPTYTGAKIFSWGMILAGQVVQVKWELVDLTTWNALNTLYAIEGTLVWEIETTEVGGKKYEVVFSHLEGRLIAGQVYPYRENVVAGLTIVKEVTG